MNKKVLCPYCGAEMIHTEPHLHTKPNGIGCMIQCHYYCTACHSCAPWADIEYCESDDEVINAAYKIALKRV